ncbi:hypothetical protein NLG97_g10590 [Lecanicillium saksenae]|uniref:Uncharacterized protein n=1 Tax=Lecanicillium saksenae TaxID=468837 RepID=A0ACC1QD92_9HYPO|nr:hypothetical protein NLG97_g10590 [Lecanicillium saksenae]
MTDGGVMSKPKEVTLVVGHGSAQPPDPTAAKPEASKEPSSRHSDLSRQRKWAPRKTPRQVRRDQTRLPAMCQRWQGVPGLSVRARISAGASFVPRPGASEPDEDGAVAAALLPDQGRVGRRGRVQLGAVALLPAAGLA